MMTDRINAPLHRRNRTRANRTQLLSTLAGLVLGLCVPRIGGPRLPAPPVAGMLLTLGFGVIGVTAVVFSLLFLVVQWAHTNFSPRLTLFREAPIVWRTFAYALSVSVFSITAALAIGTRSHVSVVVPIVAGLAVFTMLALLRSLQLQAFSSIQLAPVLEAVTERGRDILATLYPPEPGFVPSPGWSPPPLSSTVTWAGPAAVLQQVDLDRLVEAARVGDAVVVLHRVPGVTLPRGGAVADVHGAALPPSAVLDLLATGTERAFGQDPLLAFRLLADIVLRALSRAVNDPATAIQALDHMEDLLAGVPAAFGNPLHVADRDGAVRVVIRLPDWGEFLRTGLDDGIAAAANSPMVLVRLRTLLSRLIAQDRGPHQVLLTRRLAWVEEELAGRFPLIWGESAEESS